MVKNVGPAGLERIELKRLTERVGRLFSVLQEAAQEQLPAIAGAWVPPVGVCETANAICIRIELPGVSASQPLRGSVHRPGKLCVHQQRQAALGNMRQRRS